ncbi:hypothetical protein AB6F95_004636 [Salmonella enterica]
MEINIGGVIFIFAAIAGHVLIIYQQDSKNWNIFIAMLQKVLFLAHRCNAL